MVPAVLYGHGTEPVHVALPGHATMMALKQSNALFEPEVAGKRTLALPKDVQRDPLRGFIEHVDLLIVRRGEKVTVDIPVQLTGEPARNTLVITENDRLSVLADATRLPDRLEVSIEGLEAGSRVSAADVTLPEGVELAADPETVVAMVAAAPTEEQMAGETAEAAEEPAEGAEEAAAPEAATAEA